MEVSPVYLLLSAPGGAPFKTAAAYSFFFLLKQPHNITVYILHIMVFTFGGSQHCSLLP